MTSLPGLNRTRTWMRTGCAKKLSCRISYDYVVFFFGIVCFAGRSQVLSVFVNSDFLQSQIKSCRLSAYYEIFKSCFTAIRSSVRRRDKPGNRTNSFLNDTWRTREGMRIFIFQKICHDIAPNWSCSCNSRSKIAHRAIVIISNPSRNNIIRSVSDSPVVPIIIGCSGFKRIRRG